MAPKLLSPAKYLLIILTFSLFASLVLFLNNSLSDDLIIRYDSTFSIALALAAFAFIGHLCYKTIENERILLGTDFNHVFTPSCYLTILLIVFIHQPLLVAVTQLMIIVALLIMNSLLD